MMLKPQAIILPPHPLRRKTPKPYDDASAHTLMSVFGSCIVSKGERDSAVLSLLNAITCSTSQTQQSFLEKRSTESGLCFFY